MGITTYTGSAKNIIIYVYIFTVYINNYIFYEIIGKKIKDKMYLQNTYECLQYFSIEILLF